MKKYAVLKNNVIINILDLDDEQCIHQSSLNEVIIDIDNLEPIPEIGWNLDGNKLVPPMPLNGDEKLIKIMELRFKFGNKLADEMTRKMSFRNIKLINSGQTMNINTVIANFNQIEAAMRKCALPTAKAAINGLKATYPEYLEEFDYALSEINNQLDKENSL